MAFSDEERRLLLATPGIGSTVVDRLEAAGFTTLHDLCEAGAARVAEQVRAQVGQGAWLNRRRALERAISLATQQASQAHAQARAHAQRAMELTCS